MSSEEDFDDIIEMLGGFGKYQKRLLFLLLGPLFFIMPFPLLHQVEHIDLDLNLAHTPARSPLLYYALPFPVSGGAP